MRWGALAVGVAAVVVVLFVGLKVGGEMHYRNCLQRVELEYPAAFQARGSNTESPNQFSELTEPKPHFEFFQQPNREVALRECHSWP
jgi:hypothetical protein